MCIRDRIVVLKDERRFFTQPDLVFLLDRVQRQPLAVEFHHSPVGLLKKIDAPQQCCFAGTAGAEDRCV